MNQRIEHILEFLKEDPTDSFMNYALGLEYVKEDKLEQAIELFQKVLANDPNYSACYYQLGRVYQLTGEIEKASEVYIKGMDVTKSNPNRKTYQELKEAYNLMLDEDF